MSDALPALFAQSSKADAAGDLFGVMLADVGKAMVKERI